MVLLMAISLVKQSAGVGVGVGFCLVRLRRDWGQLAWSQHGRLELQGAVPSLQSRK
jgi:hypothetical protein